ncbi:CYIR protein [Plasmodium cynomolgi strain B]|uniref:CYIR protein n=1 Tax=Plasmodium cynomolgi (strain B) TaxID=1120755 RepID=K6VJ84_PLACD|nr:CYIR protein [Plasmodium cynomolgi strain B]GAB69457.1 CYIR protein [Plasmodium cynomolgi strain B]
MEDTLGYFDEERGNCDGFKFYSRAKDELYSYPELQKISDKILKAVCYVYNIKSDVVFPYDTLCDFLYFWLGNTLINNLEEKQYFNEVIYDLFYWLYVYDNKDICDFPYTDYDDYKLDLAMTNRSCKKEYKNYLTTYVDNYKQLHKECKLLNEKHKYCTEFFNYYYDDEMHKNLISWSCNLTETLPEAKPLPGKLEVAEHQKKLDYRPKRVAPKIKMQQIPLITPKKHIRNRASLGRILDDITPRKTIPSDDKTTSITSKSINSVVSVAGILVPSYLAYRYTPAGTWIRKLLGRNTETNYNPYVNQELMENFSVPEDFYSERSRYNISYSPE